MNGSTIHLKIMAQANAVISNTIRQALPRMDANGNVTLSGDQLMQIMSNAGVVANSILSLQADGPAEPSATDDIAIAFDLHNTSAVEQSARQDMEVAKALESGLNIPADDEMQRAIAAASLINKANRAPAPQPEPLAPLTLQQRIAKEQLDQEGQNQTELVTGSTGVVAAADAKPVSAANAERNRQIQDRLRRQINASAGAPAAGAPEPRPVPRVVPRVTPAAAAAKAAMEAPVRPQVTPAVKPAVRSGTVDLSARQIELNAAAAEALQAAQIERTDVPAEVTSRTPLASVGPGPRPDGYQPAVGTARDIKTINPNVQSMNSVIPAEEMLAGATATDGYDPIPGVNTNIPSPYSRLTDPEFSEFAKLFETSAFTPDCKGFVGITHENFPWNREVELPKLGGPALVRMPQGFYGFNPHNGGPNYVMIRLPRNIIIWNFNHTPGNCRIFYIGRSNITGIWYTPEAMDKLELFTTVAELAEARVALAHKMAGTTYKKVANSLL